MGNENYPQSWLSLSSYEEVQTELFKKYRMEEEKFKQKAIYALYLAIEFSSRVWEIEETFERMIPLIKELEEQEEETD